jgi:hypothetical protein
MGGLHRILEKDLLRSTKMIVLSREKGREGERYGTLVLQNNGINRRLATNVRL